uniref:Uncharacterized protein n=1 Tax=Oryza meridionalis TaxID=40149 RepID=A0A0E0EWG5_9ORYZ
MGIGEIEAAGELMTTRIETAGELLAPRIETASELLKGAQIGMGEVEVIVAVIHRFSWYDASCLPPWLHRHHWAPARAPREGGHGTKGEATTSTMRQCRSPPRRAHSSCQRVAEERVAKVGSTDLVWSRVTPSWLRISDVSSDGRMTCQSTVNGLRCFAWQ